ncbi:mannose-6-phosphate isomerase, class I [Proteinivorax tanatarense]|uniref:mannose-6-phosphate isomerase n=1 Tax=Proteinivorax tanatarense TaxID=1260629 RepID=A0AAU7VJR8_9FIRM
MIKEPLFLGPVFKERLWGGKKLKTYFNYDIPSNKTGECWAVSAHPSGESIILNSKLKGKSLKTVWEDYPQVFGYPRQKKFPLLIKILDANKDLSVQVHPDDRYAKANEVDGLGKTECWYIVDCDEDAEIVLGHKAKTHDELKKLVYNKKFESLLTKKKIRPGDFIYIPSGTIHGLCKNTVVLEVQQSSDTTYRLYDYNRKDELGNTRELHLKQAIDVIATPHDEPKNKPTVEKRDGVLKTKFIDNSFFTVQKWNIEDAGSFDKSQPFMICSVLKGDGKLVIDEKEYSIAKSSHFILPCMVEKFSIHGENLEIFVSYI